MADRIKGITIEVDGDTTGLSKALKGVNSDLKTAQSGLNDVNKLLKLDPGNVELLRQKQEYLNDAISSTEEKLAKEKEALEQMKNADGFDKNSEQAKALERQIIADEEALESLNKEMKDFGSVGAQQIAQVGEKFQQVGEKMTAAGTALTKGLTVPIAAVGAGSVAAFNEVDAGLDIVTQKTGASGEALEEMHEIVKSLSTEIPADFETIGNAVGEVNTRFGVTGDELSALSEEFIQFAQINGTDVTNSVDQAQKALSAFGLGADDAGALLDRLNLTGQQTGASMDSLLNGLIQNGTAFQEMGLSIDQATVFMGQMETSGANSETVMNGLRKALKNATEEGIPLNDALAQLQETILTGTDGMDGLTAAYDMFGKSGDQIYAAVKNGTLDFNALAISAGEAGGSVADTFERAKDPTDDFKTALNGAKVAGAELGTVILESAAPLIKNLSELIKTLTQNFKSLTPQEQQAIVKIGALVAAVGPLLVVGGKMVSGIGTLLTLAPTIVTAFSTVSTFITATLIPGIGALIAAAAPILAAAAPFIAVAAAIVAAGVLVYKNWDTIKEKAGALAKAVSERWSNMKQSISETWTNIKQNTSEAWNTVTSNLSQRWENIKQKSSDTWDNIQQTASTKWESVKSTLSSTFNSIGATAIYHLDGLRDRFSSTFEAVKNTVQWAIDAIKNIMNFEWHLPHLALPHFYIGGQFSLNPPSVPYIGVDWYRKAMQDGVLFTSPTVLATPSGMKGFGDAGAEIVLGLDRLRQRVGRGQTTINVYGAAGQSEEALAEIIMQKLTLMEQRTAAGAL